MIKRRVWAAADDGRATPGPAWLGYRVERPGSVVVTRGSQAPFRCGRWSIYRRLGLTEAQILGAFPALRASDLVNAWFYVAGHRDEIKHRSVRTRRRSHWPAFTLFKQ